MASSLPTPSEFKQSAPPPAPSNHSNNLSRSGGGRSSRASSRANHQAQGAGGRGARFPAGGGGRGHPPGGRGQGANVPPPIRNAPPNGAPPPLHPAAAIPYGHVPAYLPGAASTVEQLDRRLLVILRDGRHLVGMLRAFDQFSNMILQQTSERRILVVPRGRDKGPSGAEDDGLPTTICYRTDIPLGLFIVRGDNVVLMGEVDDAVEHDKGRMRCVSLEEFERLQEEEVRRKEGGGGGDETIIWDFDMDLVA